MYCVLLDEVLHSLRCILVRHLCTSKRWHPLLRQTVHEWCEHEHRYNLFIHQRNNPNILITIHSVVAPNGSDLPWSLSGTSEDLSVIAGTEDSDILICYKRRNTWEYNKDVLQVSPGHWLTGQGCVNPDEDRQTLLDLIRTRIPDQPRPMR